MLRTTSARCKEFSRMSKPQSWIELCRSAKFSGMWVALDNCRFNPDTRQPMEGDVVDADEELALLCGRMRESGRSNCAILFCDDDVLVEERRPTPVPSLRPAMSRPD
jgi:hypothetical protein